jgi:hypothetical protein
MGSIGSRRFLHWLWRTITWMTAALAVSLAVAQAQPLPSPMPAGYRVEREGSVRWIYPTAAQPEVAALKPLQRAAWVQLGDELGAQLSPALDLRVALGPAQMQALAPSGRLVPGYATAVAFPDLGVIVLSLTEPSSWARPDMPRVLVHELSHVALQRAVGGQALPHWFLEGVAISQSNEHSLARARTLWEGTLRGDLIPLARLSQSFPARHGEVDLAYAEAADLVGHMLEGRHGPAHFQSLLAKLRDGQPFERAFAAAYGMPVETLEQQWRAELEHRFGRWPSILGGLTGLWAVGALLLVVGYVRVRRRHHQTLERWAIEEAPMLQSEQPPPTPPPPARNVADDVLDAWSNQPRHDSGVPTIVHEGRSYTLH